MFNFSSQKQTVGFAITPGIGLEAIILDKSKTSAINYGRKKVDYNFAQRNIQNYAQLKNAIIDLVDEMKIPPKSYAYLTLPNVYFDFIEMAEDTPEAGIEMALTSTAEEFYVFKKEEPMVGWCQVANPISPNQKKLAYTAFQRSEIDQIKEIFAEANLQLAGIETNYSATLRGLNLTGLIRDAVLMNSHWSALLINANSFTLFQMEGNNLREFSEVPLAIKSFSTEEAYQAIISSASQLISGATTQLFLISQTDDISAEALKKIMQFDREVIAIDSNKFSKKPLIDITEALDQNDANSTTLAVLGAVDSKSDFGLTINILNNDPNAFMGVYFTTNLLGQTVEVTTELVQKITIPIAIVFGLVFGGVIGVASTINNQQQDILSKTKKEIKKVDKQIKDEQATQQKPVKKEEGFDIISIIDEIAEDNVSTIKLYDSISTDIPKNVWLTKYYNVGGKNVAIRGIAENIVDIYEYYKNLRIASPQSEVKLTELKVITSASGKEDQENIGRFISDLAIDKDLDRLYSFVISNTEFAMMPKTDEKAETDILARPMSVSMPSSGASNSNVEKTSSQMRPTR